MAVEDLIGAGAVGSAIQRYVVVYFIHSSMMVRFPLIIWAQRAVGDQDLSDSLLHMSSIGVESVHYILNGVVRVVMLDGLELRPP